MILNDITKINEYTKRLGIDVRPSWGLGRYRRKLNLIQLFTIRDGMMKILRFSMILQGSMNTLNDLGIDVKCFLLILGRPFKLDLFSRRYSLKAEIFEKI